MDQNQFNQADQQNTYQPNTQNQPEHKLDRQQKISLAVIAVIGIGVLVFGFWHLRSGVNVPMPDFGKENNQAENNIATDTRDETLKNLDSDNDGLNDYDEQYVYQTSAYLEDSDSDGYSDKEEIENGFDPNCPAGQNCFSEAFVDEDQAVLQTTATDTDMDVQELRSMLLSTGEVDEETLNQVDDETLMELYSQTVEPSEQGQLTNPSDYTPDQIREILVEEGGLSEEEVNSFDDETIMQMYKEALEQVQAMENE